MLKSLSEAKEYAISRVELLTGETINETERAIVVTGLEADFFDKIKDLVDGKKIEKMQIKSPEELDAFLNYSIPNYLSLLEETTITRLSAYLSQ